MFSLWNIMYHLSSGKSSKPQSPQKAFGRAWGCQEELGSQRRRNETTSGKNAKARGC